MAEAGGMGAQREDPPQAPHAEHLPSEAATLEAGERLAATLNGGEVIALIGRLGAGKTHFVKGLLRGLGSSVAVTSPTFTLVQEYGGGRLPVYHFDFYRVETVEELWDLGWDDYLAREGVVVVEWADRHPRLFPEQSQWWELTREGSSGGRRLTRRASPALSD